MTAMFHRRLKLPILIIVLVSISFLTSGCWWRQNELLREELFTAKGELAAVRKEHDGLKVEHANLQQRYNKLTQEMTETEMGKRSLNDQCQERITELEEEKKKIEDSMGAETNRLRAQIAELEQGGAKSGEEKIALAQRLQEAEYQVEKLTADTKALEEKFNSAENQRALLAKKIETSGADIQQRDAAIADLQKTISDKDALISERDTKIETMAQQVKEAEAKTADAQKKLDAQTDQLFDTIAQAAAAEFATDVKNGTLAIELDRSTGVRLIVFNSVLFEPGAIVMNANAQPLIRRIGAFLQRYPERKVEVQGHSDNVPVANMPYPDNWGVGSARAEKVLRELVSVGGVSPDRLRAASHSQYSPLDSNATPEGRARNRRVEIVIKSQPGK